MTFPTLGSLETALVCWELTFHTEQQNPTK